jgi:hypothetical protein
MIDNYLAYWKRGWWCALLLLVTNILVFLSVYPLAYLFFDNDILYWTSSLIVAVAAIVPIWGLTFEWFAKRSIRIAQKALSSE